MHYHGPTDLGPQCWISGFHLFRSCETMSVNEISGTGERVESLGPNVGEVYLEQDRQRLWIPTTNYTEEDSKGPPRVRIGLLYQMRINTKGFI